MVLSLAKELAVDRSPHRADARRFGNADSWGFKDAREEHAAAHRFYQALTLKSLSADIHTNVLKYTHDHSC